MPAETRGIAGGVSILLLATAPLVIYRATQGFASPWLAGAAAAIQIVAIAWVLTGQWLVRYRVGLGAGLLAIAASLVVLPGLPARSVALIVTGGCHAAAYLSLLLWFATSLRPNHEPAVTGFARRIRQTMPDKVVRYTRKVTVAWCIFFAAQLVVSLALLLAAPGAAWSTFINLLNLPLVVAMVLLEFGCRLIVFRHEPRTSMAATLLAVRHTRVMPASRL